MIVDTVLYLLVALSLAYSIFRYARYSVWERTDAGRAVMLLMCSLMTLVLYGLAAVSFLEGDAKAITRRVVVSLILVAIVYQASVLTGRQGGFRRKLVSRRKSIDLRE